MAEQRPTTSLERQLVSLAESGADLTMGFARELLGSELHCLTERPPQRGDTSVGFARFKTPFGTFVPLFTTRDRLEAYRHGSSFTFGGQLALPARTIFRMISSPPVGALLNPEQGHELWLSPEQVAELGRMSLEWPARRAT